MSDDRSLQRALHGLASLFRAYACTEPAHRAPSPQ